MKGCKLLLAGALALVAVPHASAVEPISPRYMSSYDASKLQGGIAPLAGAAYAALAAGLVSFGNAGMDVQANLETYPVNDPRRMSLSERRQYVAVMTTTGIVQKMTVDALPSSVKTYMSGLVHSAVKGISGSATGGYEGPNTAQSAQLAAEADAFGTNEAAAPGQNADAGGRGY